MKKSLLVFLSALFAYTTYAAQTTTGGGELNPVNTAVPLLSIAPDSRSGGMGDVGGATSPDVNSQYWNPAKYPFMESRGGLGISYTPWLSKLVSDINLANVSGYWKFAEGQGLSASLRYFSLGEVQFLQHPDDEPVNVKPNEFAIDLAYSRLLSEKWAAAVAFRYIRSDLNPGGGTTGSVEFYPGNSFAADIAAFYTTPITMTTGDAQASFGVNISNIGNKMTYDKGENYDFLPTNLRLGGSFMFPFDEFNKLSLNVDLNKFLVPTYPRRNSDDDPTYNDRLEEYQEMSVIAGIFRSFSDAPRGFKEEMEEIMWSVGLEYSYMNQFFVRAGYFNENKNKGNRKYFTAGAGFKLNVFQLDAAYVIAVSQTNPLDQTLRFSLSFDLDGLKGLVR